MPAQRKVSIRQTEILLSFLEAHKDLAKGRVSHQGGPLGKQANYNQWDLLAEKLNCCGSGATKSAKEWKVYWNNLKYKVRSKTTMIRRHQSGTGGGPALEGGNLTPEETRILAILGKESVFGEESVRIPFPEFNDEVPAPRTSSTQQVLSEEDSALSLGGEVIVTDDIFMSPEPVLPLPVAPAAEAHAPEIVTPAARTPETRASPAPVQQPAPTRSYVRRIADIPAWAREIEERHVAAQERTAVALEMLLAVQREILCIIKSRL